MKRLLIALSVLATPALAQPVPDNTALAAGALSQELLQCVSGKVDLRTQTAGELAALRAQIVRLQAELDKAKAQTSAPETPPNLK